ncbi:EamA family transporter [Haloarcula amylovorans]|uniref:EamA family transporter n=1 Tax=Haloarcula amylovorans TaxID=2562280 RepID=UPI0010766481|nr:EamA family transporter [Halomicroarcula amylolytica]
MVTNQSILFAVAAMFLYAGWALLAKFATQRIPVGQAVAVTYVAGLVAVGGYFLLVGGDLSGSTVGISYGLLSGLFLGCGTLAYYAALNSGSAAIATSVSGMYLLVTSVLAILFLDETLTSIELAGLGFAVVAVVLLSQ